MAYTALYRKFRPINFNEMVGQEHITKTLKNQIIANRVGHAYLFSGGRGSGKTSTAKILARAVNCLHPVDGGPCNECETKLAYKVATKYFEGPVSGNLINNEISGLIDCPEFYATIYKEINSLKVVVVVPEIYITVPVFVL